MTWQEREMKKKKKEWTIGAYQFFVFYTPDIAKKTLTRRL
jgi:hypothetical protein